MTCSCSSPLLTRVMLLAGTAPRARTQLCGFAPSTSTDSKVLVRTRSSSHVRLSSFNSCTRTLLVTFSQALLPPKVSYAAQLRKTSTEGSLTWRSDTEAERVWVAGRLLGSALARELRHAGAVQAEHPCLLENILEFLEATSQRRLAIFLDYDGTLTPIVKNPDRAYMSDQARCLCRTVPCSEAPEGHAPAGEGVRSTSTAPQRHTLRL